MPLTQWNANTTPVNVISEWGQNPGCHLYQKIHDFLSDEKSVLLSLVELGKEARKCDTYVTFDAVLAKFEKEAGFSENVITLQRGGSRFKFLQYVQAKRPVWDAGLRGDHGALTHRIQWVALAMKYREFVEEPAMIATVYSELAKSYAERYNEGKGSVVTLWDQLVDSPFPPNFNGAPVANARSPEYLMKYMTESKDIGLKKLAQLSRDASFLE